VLLPCASLLQADFGMQEMQMRTGDALLISTSFARASQQKQKDEQKENTTFLETRAQELTGKMSSDPVDFHHSVLSHAGSTPRRTLALHNIKTVGASSTGSNSGGGSGSSSSSKSSSGSSRSSSTSSSSSNSSRQKMENKVSSDPADLDRNVVFRAGGIPRRTLQLHNVTAIGGSSTKSDNSGISGSSSSNSQEIPIQPLRKMRSAKSDTPGLEMGTGRYNTSLYTIARTFIHEVTNYTMRTSAAEYLRSEEGVRVRNRAYLMATATMSEAPIVVPLIFGVLICLTCIYCGSVPEETEPYPHQGPASYAARPVPVTRQYQMKIAPSNMYLGPSPPPSLPGMLPQAHPMQYNTQPVAMTRPAGRMSFAPTLPPASLAASPNTSIQGGMKPTQLYAPAIPAGLGLTQVVMQKLLDGDAIGLTMNDDLTLGAFADQRAVRFGWAIGDRVLKINGVAVTNKTEFMAQLHQAKEANRTMGQPLTFDVQR